MKLLFPLIPTPRATKRFVNVYRLLRGLTTGAQRTALIGNETDGGYRQVLVLLAMVTGYPVEATEVMREYTGTPETERLPGELVETPRGDSRESRTGSGSSGSGSIEALKDDWRSAARRDADADQRP